MRFVEEQQLRPGNEHSGNPEPLDHPAREVANAIVGAKEEPNVLKAFWDRVARCAVEVAEELQVLGARQVEVDLWVVAEVADLGANRS